ncbi:hypothetical protein ANCCAN_25001 [Ancylostoma caninum]|uniref:Uncharacterized protein n=1 Tax=Ancylostoma caninum TaxID=29170 RepID=A0A368FEK2_ANCCA|nr:hypothetical protein ANCCAN_25001 [Ancylostoma caninum]
MKKALFESLISLRVGAAHARRSEAVHRCEIILFRVNCRESFNSFDKPSGHAGDAFFSLAETGVEKKRSAAAEKKKSLKSPPSSSISPPLEEPVTSEDSTITQFEASFSKPRPAAAEASLTKPRPVAAETSLSKPRPTATAKPKKAAQPAKDWDDDAWAILNS